MEGLSSAASKLLKLNTSTRKGKSGAPVGYKASNLNYWGCLQCRNFSNHQFNPECTTCGGSRPPNRFAMMVNGVSYLCNVVTTRHGQSVNVYCPSTGFSSKMPMFYISDDNVQSENVKFAIERLEVRLSEKEMKILRTKLYQQSFTTHGSDLGALFNSINQHHDGQITIKELSKCVMRIMPLTSKQELFNLMQLADQDKSGTLDKNEFIRFIKGDYDSDDVKGPADDSISVNSSSSSSLVLKKGLSPLKPEERETLSLFDKVLDNQKSLVYDSEIGRYIDANTVEEGVDHRIKAEFNYAAKMESQKVWMREATLSEKNRRDFVRDDEFKPYKEDELREECALCERICPKVELVGAVSFHAVASWRSEKGSPINPADHRFALEDLYNSAKLCIFCTQFFDGDLGANLESLSHEESQYVKQKRRTEKSSHRSNYIKQILAEDNPETNMINGVKERPLSAIKLGIAVQKLKDTASTFAGGRFVYNKKADNLSGMVDQKKVGSYLRDKYKDDSIVISTRNNRLLQEKLEKQRKDDMTARRLKESRTEGSFFITDSENMSQTANHAKTLTRAEKLKAQIEELQHRDAEVERKAKKRDAQLKARLRESKEGVSPKKSLVRDSLSSLLAPKASRLRKDLPSPTPSSIEFGPPIPILVERCEKAKVPRIKASGFKFLPKSQLSPMKKLTKRAKDQYMKPKKGQVEKENEKPTVKYIFGQRTVEEPEKDKKKVNATVPINVGKKVITFDQLPPKLKAMLPPLNKTQVKKKQADKFKPKGTVKSNGDRNLYGRSKGRDRVKDKNKNKEKDRKSLLLVFKDKLGKELKCVEANRKSYSTVTKKQQLAKLQDQLTKQHKLLNENLFDSFGAPTGSPTKSHVQFTVTNGEQFGNDNEYDADEFETDTGDSFVNHKFQSEGASNVLADWSSAFIGIDEEVDTLVDRIENNSLSWGGHGWAGDEIVSNMALSPRAASVQSATSRRPSRRGSNERPRSRTSRDANATVEVIKMPYYESGTESSTDVGHSPSKKVSISTVEEQDAALSPKMRIHKKLQNSNLNGSTTPMSTPKKKSRPYQVKIQEF